MNKKIILIFSTLFLLLLSLNVFGALSDNLTTYLSFDSNISTIVPNLVTSINNGTLIDGALLTTSDKVLGASSLSCDGVDDWVAVNDANNTFDFTGDFSFNFWEKQSSATYGTWYMGRSRTLTYSAYILGNANPTTNLDFYGSNSGSSWSVTADPLMERPSFNAWHMITISKIGTNISFYKDGNYSTSVTHNGNFQDQSDNLGICQGQSGAPFMQVLIDEFASWKGKGLNSSEIAQLYNGGNGISYNQINGNSITLNTSLPLNQTYTFNTTPIFSSNVTGINGNWNLSLILNGTSKGVYNSVSTSGIYNITSSVLSVGEYVWWFNATDNANTSSSFISDKRYIYIAGATSNTNIKTCQFNSNSISLSSMSGCN
jgi:hypothetical protein